MDDNTIAQADNGQVVPNQSVADQTDNSGGDVTVGEISAAMKKALREEGKKALLKELGVTDYKTAKEELDAYRKSIEANKTEIDKEREARATAEQSATDNLRRAEHYEACLTAIKVGANADTVDDLVTIAAAKAAEDGKTVTDVIETLRGIPAYSGFFSCGQTQPTGTGNPIGIRRPANSNTPKESLAARLANAQRASATIDSPYFR